MKTIKHPYTVLSTKLRLTKDPQSKKLLGDAYAKTRWQQTTTSDTLENIIKLPALATITTTNLIVIDFDQDKAFADALAFNDSLNPQHQCKFIVKSSRHGGHFYFAPPTPPSDITPPEGHTKQAVLDYLSTSSHNVIAPTEFDEAKHILTAEELTPYNDAFNTYTRLLVLQNLPKTARHLTLYDPNSRHSDDACNLVKGYISNIVSQEQFESFYSIPHPIPAGNSNEVYLTLSTRLGSDETISEEDYLAAFEKFNSVHGRKTPAQLHNEITHRMVPTEDNPQGINGLWRYEENKRTDTFVVTHKLHKTQISTFYDYTRQEYIVYYLNQYSEAMVHTLSSATQYVELLEKLTLVRRDVIRKRTNEMAVIKAINNYAQPSGYDPKTETFNKAFINTYLTAFYGTKPENYSTPTKLLELAEYMWGEEYQYMLDITKYRYTTFEFSPVVTFLKGTEGSGKDLSIALLTKGFSKEPQNLNYSLLKDKHSSWQTEENCVFSEIGSWKPYERDDLLSELKSVSGSNGKVTFRDMQKTAQVVPTLIKIWVTGNEWVKLHTDPLTQRRIHIVYMPRPLEMEVGGPYTAQDLEDILTDKNILDFYYWLGNIYTLSDSFSRDRYKNATHRQKTESYSLYLENTQNKADTASTLIWCQNYNEFIKATALFNIPLSELDYKYSRAGNLLVSVHSIKEEFGKYSGGTIVKKTLDRIVSEKEGNKRLKFSRKIVEKYITLYNAPAGLETVDAIQGV